ncbi:putative LRR receptor-like serine/threonine-protein kinase [Heracleum sosnowskyi]|uniref:LRR receptor-like serine/threonine-protein kinase n=1 Tax=Heracleum sosnowskyi TaxID=360622 RepID=A0AAD8I3D0_9APIA|nr:putative LRR receptor-like serine/threonine-protein kinase [Heracleum sosnowskyi]
MNSKASSWFTSFFFLLILLCKCSTLSVNKSDVLSLLALKDQIQGGLSSWNQSLLPGSAENLNGNQSTSLGVKGSIGYVPPEYGMGGATTTQGDVYSYGILLLELFTGRRPTDEMFAEGLDIHNFVGTALPDQVREIVDPILISEEEEEEEAMVTCIASILRIGIACSAQTPGERKDMEQVDTELHSIKEQYKAFLNRKYSL